MKAEMKIGYVTTYDATNVNSWSGTGYHMAEALSDEETPIELIGNLKEPFSLMFKAKQFFYKYGLGQRHLRDREPYILRSYGRQVSERVSNGAVDVIVSPGTIPISFLECRQGIAFWTDATFAAMIDFYPEFSNMSAASIANGNAMEQAALERCDLALYSSDWAARSAIETYGVNAEKVHVVPFGANVTHGMGQSEIHDLIEGKPTDRCRLLFLGVSWERKGGDVALAAAEALNSAGLPTELSVVGCEPTGRQSLPDFVHPLGFIDKGTSAGRERLNALLAQAHFLLLPSRAECCAIVLCEANAFGVPALASSAGGNPTAVRPGRNGNLFPVEATGADYAAFILEQMADKQRYRELARGAYAEYQTRLNWAVAGGTARRLIREYCLH